MGLPITPHGPKARIVLTTWGSFGDLFPFLGIALELKRRGHDPVIATSPVHGDAVRRAGISFHPVRPDIDPDDAELVRRIMRPGSGTKVILKELLVPAIRDSFDDLRSAVRDADLLVTHPVTFAGPLVAGTLRLPWVSTVLAPMSFFSAHDVPVFPGMAWAARLQRLGLPAGRALVGLAKAATRRWMRPVAEFRRELRLPGAGDPLYEGQFSPWLTLALFSRVLARRQPDWPSDVRVTGFVRYTGDAGMPAGLDAFLDEGPPPLVFTLGSSAVGAAGRFYEVSARAAAALDRRAVLLVGRDARNRPPSLPDGVIAVEYAPHDALFPRAEAVVHHGGIGTTGQALASGRPMLVVPFAHDQPDTAARVERLGVARVVSPRSYRVSRVAAALRRLLSDPRYADRARAVGDEVRAEEGARRAASELEGFLVLARRLRA